MKALSIISISAACLLPNLSFAEDQILVEAKATRAGMNGKQETFASPSMVTSDGTPATLKVTRPFAVPESVGGAEGAVRTGGSVLEITPVIDKDTISFRAHLTIREAGEEQKTEACSSMAVSTQELFMTGRVKPGGAVVLKTTNALSGVVTWTVKLTKVFGLTNRASQRPPAPDAGRDQ